MKTLCIKTYIFKMDYVCVCVSYANVNIYKLDALIFYVPTEHIITRLLFMSILQLCGKCHSESQVIKLPPFTVLNCNFHWILLGFPYNFQQIGSSTCCFQSLLKNHSYCSLCMLDTGDKISKIPFVHQVGGSHGPLEI